MAAVFRSPFSAFAVALWTLASVLPASTAPRNMDEFRKRYTSEMRQRVGV